MEEINLEHLYKLAYTDLMTGLKNRNSYEEKLIELRKVPGMLDNLSVIVIDIDNLRFINNSFGHYCGDEAIKSVAECIIKAFHDDSYCARIGGDEFILFTYSDGLQKLENFNLLLTEKQLQFDFPLSVSTGLVKFVKDRFKSIDDLIKSCEKKMYRNKQLKRQTLP